jgi:hypothetical protein
LKARDRKLKCKKHKLSPSGAPVQNPPKIAFTAL